MPHDPTARESRDGSAEGRPDPGPFLRGANSLLGNDVHHRDGKDLGDIAELVLDTGAGRVAYAVLSFSGLRGMGDRLFAVPWAALELDSATQRFRLDLGRERLREAPGFHRDQWPTMSDRTWARAVHAFYGTPYAG